MNDEQLGCACNERAARRSLSRPGELIYIWGMPDRKPRHNDNFCGFLVADEEELQINNVRDHEIVSVWRDGEEISE